MKPINIKYYLTRTAILIACFIVVSSFKNRSAQNKFFNAEVAVSIVQENDGFAVSVKTAKNINVHFYMFTVDGRLVKELNIYGSNRVSIHQLEKGIYIYDFFTNDKRLKNGKIELR